MTHAIPNNPKVKRRRLRTLWPELPRGVRRYSAEKKSPEERAVAERISEKTWDYHRIGHDRRTIEFLPDGSVGQGSAGRERFWDIDFPPNATAPILELFRNEGRTLRAQEGPDGVWRGKWECFEKMPIELTPSPQEPCPIPKFSERIQNT